MAITVTELVEYMNTANTSTPTSGTYTPSASSICLSCVIASGTVLTTPVGSGNGIDPWTRDAGGTQSTFAAAVFHTTVGASPTTTGFTADYTGDAVTGAGIWVAELGGIDATTPIRQVTPLNNGLNSETPNVTFSVSTLSDSAVVVFLHNTTNPSDVAVPTGYTDDVNLGHGGPNVGFRVAHHLTPGAVTTVTWGGTSASAWRGYGVEIAASAAANADVTLTTVAGVAALTGNTVAADANETLSVVAGVAAVGALTVTGDANISLSTVAALAAVPAPTVEASSPDADIILITVAAVASVGTLTVAADANITLVTVVAIAAVGTPTVTADASITLTPVAALAAAPAPTIEANANAPPDTVAAIAAVPTPTVTADASVSLSTVAATAAIPTPTVAATADITLSTVVAIAAVGAPTVTADADVPLGSVPAVASIPAPTVAGDANVDLTTVEALVAIETPLVETGVNADVDLVTVEAIADVPAPIVAADADVTLGVVVATAAVPSPSVSATSTFFAVALVVGGGEISATGYRYRAIIPETHIVGEWSENRSLEGANMPGKSW